MEDYQKKKKKREELELDKTFSRPTGTPVSENVDITGMPPQEKRAIQEKHALEGQKIAEEAPEKARAEEVVQQEAEAQRFPEQPIPEQPMIIEEPKQVKIGDQLLTEEKVAQGLMSGSVTPLSADDLFSVASLGSGGLMVGAVGITAKAGVKATGRKVLSGAISLTRGKLGMVVGLVGAGVTGAVVKDLLEGGATERQGAINTYGQLATTTTEGVAMSLSTPQQARADLDFLEKDLNRLASEIKKGFINEKYLKLTGQMNDINADILDAQQEIRLARFDISNIMITDPDAIEMAYFIEETRKKYGVKYSTMEERMEEIKK